MPHISHICDNLSTLDELEMDGERAVETTPRWSATPPGRMTASVKEKIP
jgi:hypothetical protein